MPNTDYMNIEYIKNESTNNSFAKRCIRNSYKPSYKCIVDFKTYLRHTPRKNSKIKQFSRVIARIEKICEGKIIIGGILYKTICYTTLSKKNFNNEVRCIKHKKIPFRCYVDIDHKYLNDKFKIVDCKAVCNYLRVINEKKSCSNTAVLIGKDIVKITVKREPCTKNCSYYLGNSVVESEICFVPAINPKSATVSVDVDPKNFKVMLICCELIVVSGVITKTVTFNDGAPPAKEDILVQVNLPASIEDLKKVDKNKWKVTQVEICDGCYYFSCPNEDETTYHKLVGKDILSVEVSYKHMSNTKCEDN